MTVRKQPQPLVTCKGEPSAAAHIAVWRYTLARIAARKAGEGK